MHWFKRNAPDQGSRPEHEDFARYLCSECGENFTVSLLPCDHICVNCLQRWFDTNSEQENEPLHYYCFCGRSLEFTRDSDPLHQAVYLQSSSLEALKSQYTEYLNHRELAPKTEKGPELPSQTDGAAKSFKFSLFSKSSSEPLQVNQDKEKEKPTNDLFIAELPCLVDVYTFDPSASLPFEWKQQIRILSNDQMTTDYFRLQLNPLLRKMYLYGCSKEKTDNLKNFLFKTTNNSYCVVLCKEQKGDISKICNVSAKSYSATITINKSDVELYQNTDSFGFIIFCPGVNFSQYYTINSISIEGLNASQQYIFCIVPTTCVNNSKKICTENDFSNVGGAFLVSFVTTKE